MKLYYSKGACSLGVRIIINELGLSSEYESVNLKTKKTGSGADFLTVNPKGAVPTLVTNDNHILTENSAIQQYLADSQHANHLLPPVNDFKRYQVIEWLSYISSDLHKSCGPFFNPTLSQDMKDNFFKPMLTKKIDYIENKLGKNVFLMGEQFTLPDAYLFVILSWFPKLGLDIQNWPNLVRYFDNLKNRKSIQQSLKEEAA